MDMYYSSNKYFYLKIAKQGPLLGTSSDKHRYTTILFAHKIRTVNEYAVKTLLNECHHIIIR